MLVTAKRRPRHGSFPSLYELGDFEGLKGQADRHQLAKTAKIITTEFYYLKTDELLLFFYRFCVGRYGQFYSYFAPSVIIRSLRDFLKERARAFEQYEQTVRERAWQEAKHKAVTYEKYLQHKKCIFKHLRFTLKRCFILSVIFYRLTFMLKELPLIYFL